MPKKIELSRSEMEDVLAWMHRVSPEGRSKLQARLRHFQRLGMPPTTNTGKGKPAIYGARELVALTIVFELSQLGLTPERIIALFDRFADQIFDAVSRVGEEGSEYKGGRILLLLDPLALKTLQEPGKENEQFFLVTANLLEDLLEHSPVIGARFAVVDLQSSISGLRDALIYTGHAKDIRGNYELVRGLS